MATDPPAPFRPTMWPHNSSREPHIVESAQRRDVLDLGELCAHLALRLEEPKPEPWSAKTKWAHQGSPA